MGDTTQDDILMEAGVKVAKAIIISLPSDADNLFISISAKNINSKIMIVSRAYTESAERKLKEIEVNHVIMPEKLGGIYMAGFVAQEDLTEFLNHLRVDHNNLGILSELDCPEINSKFLNTNVETLFSSREEINVIGIKLNMERL